IALRRPNLSNPVRGLSWPYLTAIVLAVVGTVAAISNRSGGAYSFAKFVGILSAGYLLFHAISWWRSRLLWSLRNRLIVAYLFIAVVPVLLLLTLAVLAGQILYSQLGGYLLYEDIRSRLGDMADSTANIAAAERTLPASISEKVVEDALDAQIHLAYAKELPGLKIEFHADPRRLVRVAGPGAKEFTGILQSNAQTHLIAMREVESSRGKNLVELSVLIPPEFLETVAPDLGPIQVTALQRADGENLANVVRLGNVNYRFQNRISTRHRALQ